MTKYLINLKQVPNQEFFINLANRDMTVRIIDRDILLFSLSLNNSYLVQNVPCFPNLEVLPYPYMAAEAGGNFVFVTQNDEYPYWEDFGKTCQLYFITM